jgi:hypothetical protein
VCHRESLSKGSAQLEKALLSGGVQAMSVGSSPDLIPTPDASKPAGPE